MLKWLIFWGGTKSGSVCTNRYTYVLFLIHMPPAQTNLLPSDNKGKRDLAAHGRRRGTIFARRRARKGGPASVSPPAAFCLFSRLCGACLNRHHRTSGSPTGFGLHAIGEAVGQAETRQPPGKGCEPYHGPCLRQDQQEAMLCCLRSACHGHEVRIRKIMFFDANRHTQVSQRVGTLPSRHPPGVGA